MTKVKMIDYSVDIVSGTYGLYYIHTILGILVLVLTIINLIYKMIWAIIEKIKNNKAKEIPEVIDETIDKLNELDKK